MYSLAASYLAINNDENARPLLDPLTSSADNIGREAFSLFISFYLGKARFDEAINLLKKALNRFPDLQTFGEQLLFAYEGKGDFQSALDAMDSPALQKDNDWYKKKIGYLTSLKRYDEAENLIKERSRTDHNTAFWEDVRASFLAGRGLLSDAEKIWIGLYNNTKDTSYIRACGQAYLQARDRTSAVRVSKSLMNSTDEDSWILAANVMKELTLYPELIDLYLEREKKNPDQRFDNELFNLYELTSRFQDMTLRYLDFLGRTMDLEYVRPLLAQLAAKGMDTVISDRATKLSQDLPASSGILKSHYETVLYDVALRRNETALALRHALDIMDHSGQVDFGISASDQFMEKRWLDPARELLLETIKKSKDNLKTIKAMFKLASLDHIRGDTAASLKTLDEIASKFPGKYDEDMILLYKGTAFMGQRSFPEALEAFSKIKKKSEQVHVKMGLVLFLMDKPNEAKASLQLAERDQDYASESFLIQAVMSMYASDVPSALKTLDAMARTRTADPYVHEGLWEIHALKNIFVSSVSNHLKTYATAKKAELAKEYKEAGHIYESLIPLISKYSFYFTHHAARCYDLADDNEQAILLFGKILENPDAPLWFKSNAMEKTADILDRTGRKTEAFEMYKKLILTDTQYVRLKETRMKYDNLKKILVP